MKKILFKSLTSKDEHLLLLRGLVIYKTTFKKNFHNVQRNTGMYQITRIGFTKKYQVSLLFMAILLMTLGIVNKSSYSESGRRSR